MLFVMAATWLAFTASVGSGSGQTPKPRRDVSQMPDSPFRLFANPTLVLQANEFLCGLANSGDICEDVFDSSTGRGGYWPTGTPNGYIFESGLQIAGLIPSDAGFTWAGDTVGAYFYDERGWQIHGEGITDIYDSTDPEDLQNWPSESTIPDFPQASAFIRDSGLFDPKLIGRATVSEQDSWALYWDGNPAMRRDPDHPMGILVEQRTLAWDHPKGNEATIFFLFTFTNVTNNPLFQRLNEEASFEGRNDLPDAGWRIDSIYVAFNMDPDVGDFNDNYTTAILPLDLGLTYDGDFLETTHYEYPPTHFHRPFFRGSPGLVGTKFLKTPISSTTGKPAGMTLFTQYQNPSAPSPHWLLSPVGIPQLWRTLSMNISPILGDSPCMFPDPKERRLCSLLQTDSDVLVFQSTGPFSLEPGASQTLVVAMLAAATVETEQIVLGDLVANAPGIPSPRPGCEEPVRPIELGAGWLSTPPAACAGSGDVDPSQIEVMPGSLVGKALVAQAIVDNKFAMPAPPEPPEFYLAPEDGRITVVWEPSPTEEAGDPYYALASDASTPLYNPNYRRDDVEGFRIYRGHRPSDLKLIAQFDKRDTRFIDRTCETDPKFFPGATCDTVRERAILSPFVQYPLGGVVDFDGYPVVLKADTALAARFRDSTAVYMVDSGIPAAFVDTTVENGFQYYYKVTAFDINSLRSGPSSLESSGKVKVATPQAPASDLTAAQYAVGLLDRTGEPLDLPQPNLDPQTGTFSGPQAPTDQLAGQFLEYVSSLLTPGTYQVRVDSVVPQYYSGEYYLTTTGQDGSVVVGNPDNGGLGGCEPACVFELPTILVPSDPRKRDELIGAGIDAPPAAGRLTSVLSADLVHWHSGDSDWAYTVPGFWDVDPPSPDALDGGSRWFSGENETMADPTLGLSHGRLDGVAVIFQPTPFQGLLNPPELACEPTAVADHMRRFFQTTWLARRAADMKVYWGSAGVDSVIDATHDLPVPYSPAIRGSYGFVNDDANGDGVIEYVDFWYLDGLQKTSNIGCASSGPNMTTLSPQPQLRPVDVDGDRLPDGQGFSMYIAGEPFIFQRSTIPSNTVWTLRTYNGIVTKASGSYTFQSTPRTAGVTGLRFAVTVQAAAEFEPPTADLSKIHTVPDPYYAASRYDPAPGVRRLLFVNLPARATIRIYSLSGLLVDIINHDDPSGGGQAEWDLRNRGRELVASGVYFYHVTTRDGRNHIGKFTIINAAPF